MFEALPSCQGCSHTSIKLSETFVTNPAVTDWASRSRTDITGKAVEYDDIIETSASPQHWDDSLYVVSCSFLLCG